MSLRVVGAGLGRTGTSSLKVALERLLGGPCHHMTEVFADVPGQLPRWQAAVDGAPYERWAPALDGFVASVDWPSCRWYAELAEANPDALVLLSTRADADAWWRSADRTIFVGMRDDLQGGEDFQTMVRALVREHIGSYDDESLAKAGYERHNDEVRRRIPADRLVEWAPSDGWQPLCAALGVPVPDEPFPLTNTTQEFRARSGWD